VRALLALAGAVLLVGLAAGTAPDTSYLLALPAALALLTVATLFAGWPRAYGLVASATGAVSVVSLAGTAIWSVSSDPTPTPTPTPLRTGGLWPLLETAALMILVALVCRWSPVRHAVPVAAVAVVAEAVLFLPIAGSPLSWWDAVTGCVFWALAGLVGAGSGCYLRWLDVRRVRAVRDARRTQRLRLATDLHDFVAHDVSAMVIQAQAARVLLRGDPDQVDQVLDRIEADGQRALASMDRTIRTLRELEDGTGASRTPLPGLADLPDLVRRYATSGTGPVELHIESGLDQVLHQEAGATLYRVVVEALTNVRRHADPGAAVAVDLARTPSGVVLSVANHATPDKRTPNAADTGRRRSGTGLAGLEQRVDALGGAFTAGPVPAGGWQVRAELPSSVLEPTP
jgi:signal transduction histidine kinase